MTREIGVVSNHLNKHQLDHDMGLVIGIIPESAA